ncbi:sulfate adenylyltransferase subunit CysN [Saccharicrinis sp. FJH2]|uniref:sulfate adenylyltransferase subunit CysN n=1 Tax=Saccharicrinis sp. FJH65 TaxID=3344659 RepID=UPI0035F4141E
MAGKDSGYLDMQLLRFTTAGSVDDGKSTLIGRLLYDSKAIFEDQMEAIERASVGKGEEEVNLALLTDGLRAEREQGITIDVAYRYFATPKRKFIIADTPGHIQYTRNMVTGASTANVAVILIDARNGVIEQTRRHSYIANLLQIPHIIVCVNKMDLVDYDQKAFESIKKDFTDNITKKLGLEDARFVPISAKNGDNVVDPSKNMDWYKGDTFLHLMETIEIKHDENLDDARFPVQYVIRPMRDEYHDFRGYAGKIASGIFKKGDKVKVLPSGIDSKIKNIFEYNEELSQAFPPQSVTIELEDDIDISRGDMITDQENMPRVGQEINLMVCWFNERKLVPRGKYAIKHTTNEVRAIVNSVNYKMDVNSLEQDDSDLTVGLNDIANITIKTAKPLFYDSYNKNRITGSLIFIDEATNETVAAGMII